MDNVILQLLESVKRQNELFEKMLTDVPTIKKSGVKRNRRNVLKFSKKEILQMPTIYQSVFAAGNLIVHYRLRKDGVYEARFHRQGIDIEVSSKDFSVLKQKFIEKLKNYKVNNDGKANVVKTFADYAEEWLNIKRVTTKPSTYSEYARMLNHDILPVFGKKPVLEIDRSALQSFLLTYVDNGTIRTADKLFLVLRCIFDVVADDYCISSPMKKVIVPNYQSKKGSAFTYEEEQQLVNYCLSNLDKDTSHALIVLLYSGMRRSELVSLNVINGVWLECDTSKERMGKNVVKRKIPFTPMMKRVLPYIDFEKAKNVNLSSLHTTMKRVFPQRHLHELRYTLHELRYTFITRCKECGVHGEVVMLWDGHEEDKTVHSSRIDRGYTDFSDEFMLREADKVDYQKWDFPI